MKLIYLQSVFDGERLHFWMEDPSIDFSVDKSVSNQDNKIPRHPFILSNYLLLEELSKFTDKPFNFELFEPKVLTVSLPTKNNLPIFINDKQKVVYQKDIQLLSWRIETLSLDIESSFQYFLATDQSNQKEIHMAPGTFYWWKLAKEIARIIKNQQYLPSINYHFSEENLVYYSSSWKYQPSESGIYWLREVTEILPQINLALADGKITAEKLIHYYINQTIDQFIRKNISLFFPDCFFQEINLNSLSQELVQWFQSLFEQESRLLSCNKDHYPILSGKIKALQNNNHSQLVTGSFQTCFQIISPQPTAYDNTWKLIFYLQSTSDTSIILPASEIWKMTTHKGNFFGESIELLGKQFLLDLGKAATIYPKLKLALEEKFPVEVNLSDNEAARLISNYCRQLEAAGFTVVMPSWWNNPETKLELVADIAPPQRVPHSTQRFNFGAIMNFDWRIALDNAKVDYKKFSSLVDLKMPFVNHRGKWIRFDPEKAQKALEFIQEHKKLPLRDVLALNVEANEQELPIVMDSHQEHSWLQRFQFTALESNIPALATPSDFKGLLRPYQQTGFSWLVYLTSLGFGPCLCDDMGLGKTIQVIAYLLHQKERSKSKTPSLIICPTSLLSNWQKELQQFAPSLNVGIHHGPNREKDNSFLRFAQKFDVILTTYTLAQMDYLTVNQITWEDIIIDEAQNIKNPRAKQTRAIKKLLSKNKIALTGTPIENKLTELWSIFDFLNPGYLGTLQFFSKQFSNPIEQGYNEIAKKRLTKIIQPFILRRLKTDKSIINDLPDKFETKVYCSLTEEQAILYQSVVNNLLRRLEETEGIQRKGLIFSTITKLKQICNHPVQYTQENTEKLAHRSNKFDRIIEMLEEIIENNNKALIFTQYKVLGELLQKFLKQRLNSDVLFLHGGIRRKERIAMIDNFQAGKNNGSFPVLILSLKAGGVGLNLTKANHVFHFDRWWNPAVENQATDRAFRIGQDKNVLVHKFVCLGTLEESIDLLIEQKKELADTIISSGEQSLSELSTDKLREILSLRSLSQGIDQA
jgi:SNF2 family DNA or RNA helicase